MKKLIGKYLVSCIAPELIGQYAEEARKRYEGTLFDAIVPAIKMEVGEVIPQVLNPIGDRVSKVEARLNSAQVALKSLINL